MSPPPFVCLRGASLDLVGQTINQVSVINWEFVLRKCLWSARSQLQKHIIIIKYVSVTSLNKRELGQGRLLKGGGVRHPPPPPDRWGPIRILSVKLRCRREKREGKGKKKKKEKNGKERKEKKRKKEKKEKEGGEEKRNRKKRKKMRKGKKREKKRKRKQKKRGMKERREAEVRA